MSKRYIGTVIKVKIQVNYVKKTNQYIHMYLLPYLNNTQY